MVSAMNCGHVNFSKSNVGDRASSLEVKNRFVESDKPRFSALAVRDLGQVT